MLTTEQSKLAADNERLIYFILRRLHLSIDEYYGAAAVGLCKAARMWKPEKSSFSSYAVTVMRNEIFMDMRKRSVHTISIETLIKDTLTISDVLPAEDDIEPWEDSDIAKQMYSEIHLTDIEKRVFDLYLQGLKQREIAEIVGFTRSYVCNIIQRVKERLRCCYSKSI